MSIWIDVEAFLAMLTVAPDIPEVVRDQAGELLVEIIVAETTR